MVNGESNGVKDCLYHKDIEVDILRRVPLLLLTILLLKNRLVVVLVKYQQQLEDGMRIMMRRRMNLQMIII